MSEPKYNLDNSTANELLNNVLDSCNIPPSPKSLDEVMFKRNLEKKPLAFAKYLAVLFLILVVISPLFFKRDPNFSVVTTSKHVAVSSHALYEDCFVMTLTGSADYDSIYARKNDGAYIFPDSIDNTSGLVIFPYNGDALNIYIPTKNGETIQAVLNETK